MINLEKINSKIAIPLPFKKTCLCTILPSFFLFFLFFRPLPPGEVIKIPPFKKRGDPIYGHPVLMLDHKGSFLAITIMKGSKKLLRMQSSQDLAETYNLKSGKRQKLGGFSFQGRELLI